MYKFQNRLHPPLHYFGLKSLKRLVNQTFKNIIKIPNLKKGGAREKKKNQFGLF